MNQPCATIDFETRSEADLKKVGTWAYSLHPTTFVLCMAFRLPTWKKGRTALWHPAFPQLGIPEADCSDDLVELFDYIDGGGLVEAHNAFFERAIWTNQMLAKGCPTIAHSQWRCSAAKGAAHALPRALEDVAEVLETDEQKDTFGSALMKKMSKPWKPTVTDCREWYKKHAPCPACEAVGKVQEFKKDGAPKLKLSKCKECNGRGHDINISLLPPIPIFRESVEDLHALWEYCRQDVLTEEEVSLTIPDLSEQETEIYLLDQAINVRGFQLDPEAVDTALRLIAQEVEILNAELLALTDGVVERATQRERMVKWFAEHGLELPNTQAATLDAFLESKGLTHECRRGLELMRSLGRSSTSKYVTMKNWICPDHRVRGGLLFHGAGTGRWSGQGVQPHNFVKGKIKDMNALWITLKDGTREEIMELYGDMMSALSYALRGVICAPAGRRLYVADYAAIEARVVLWLAGDERALDIFRRGEDIYLDMATDIYKRVCTKADKKERDMGKVAVLGLGFQMGWKKFKDTCAKFKIFITDEFAQQVVDAYREKFYLVKEMWAEQEWAAQEAVENKGEKIKAGRITWYYDYGFLYCVLPSGRKLAYPDPEMHLKKTSWGALKSTVTFMGINPKTRQWERMSLYGGLIVENETQAVARDLMAEAMLRMEKSEVYDPVLSVHDEGIAEADEDKGDVKEFEALMAQVPYWADGLPVGAEGWTGFQYRK